MLWDRYPNNTNINIWSYCQRMSNLCSNCFWKQQNHIFSGKKLRLHVWWRKISGDNMSWWSFSKLL